MTTHRQEQSIRLAHASHISQAVASLASLVANVEHGSEVAMSMDGSMPAAIASALICFVAVTEEHLSHPGKRYSRHPAYWKRVKWCTIPFAYSPI